MVLNGQINLNNRTPYRFIWGAVVMVYTALIFQDDVLNGFNMSINDKYPPLPQEENLTYATSPSLNMSTVFDWRIVLSLEKLVGIIKVLPPPLLNFINSIYLPDCEYWNPVMVITPSLIMQLSFLPTFSDNPLNPAVFVISLTNKSALAMDKEGTDIAMMSNNLFNFNVSSLLSRVQRLWKLVQLLSYGCVIYSENRGCGRGFFVWTYAVEVQCWLQKM